ncbi:nuclear transport factor 2 family protein [Nocardia sp. CC201C]|uniref:nuclear transport factor 2 family protein n=1 Tax=unclassified Nocardia TaxID=2637762 RepID=UPI0032C0CF8D
MGHRGRDAIAAFWDKAIARSVIEFRHADSFACGDEAAFVTTIRNTRDDLVVEVDAVVTYRVDANGRILALRAFWELERARTSAP